MNITRMNVPPHAPVSHVTTCTPPYKLHRPPLGCSGYMRAQPLLCKPQAIRATCRLQAGAHHRQSLWRTRARVPCEQASTRRPEREPFLAEATSPAHKRKQRGAYRTRRSRWSHLLRLLSRREACTRVCPRCDVVHRAGPVRPADQTRICGRRTQRPTHHSFSTTSLLFFAWQLPFVKLSEVPRAPEHLPVGVPHEANSTPGFPVRSTDRRLHWPSYRVLPPPILNSPHIRYTHFGGL
jgi:hypothetical protein